MMKGKKWLSMCLVLALLLCGCADTQQTAVYVQNVGELAASGAMASSDRFQGMVVSEDITSIEKDQDMTVAELLVKEGQDVVEGQELFTYDTQQLQLQLDKQKLELEQHLATIENYKQQIKDLEKERDAASSGKLEYTLQIQSTQLDLKEAEINLSAKEDAVRQSEQMLENSAVVSPVTGRVQSISESGTDSYGNPKAYITIQKTGTYRIKGALGELQRGAVMEGTRMQVFSRTDESQTWAGTVSLVDYESPTQGNSNNMYYGAAVDEMSTGSKYPFYLELDSTEGLLLGQHVYLQLEVTEQLPDLILGSAFVCYDDDGSTYVWAEENGKLQKRTVELGEYYMSADGFGVLSGLGKDDYIAFPDYELCVEGAPTTRTVPAQNSAAETIPESGVF